MQSTNAMIADSISEERRHLSGDRAVWIALMFVPVLFAAATWPGIAPEAQDKLRHLSLPVVGAELAVILLAMYRGVDIGRWFRALPNWSRMTLILLLCVAFGTAIFAAIDRSEALVRTCCSLIHLLFGISAIHLFRRSWSKQRSQVWPAVFAGTVGYTIMLLAFIAASGDGNAIDWWQLNLGVTNIRQTGFYSLIGACSALGLALSSRSRAVYWLWISGGAVILSLSFWGGTRSSLMAFFAAAMSVFIMLPSCRTRSMPIATVMIVLLAMPLSLIHDPGEPFMGLMRMFSASNPASGDVTTGRWETWQLTTKMILDRPLFGAGESQFRLLYEPWHAMFNHPHNWLLQIAFQWGLIGAACYFALAGMLLCRFLAKSLALGSEALPAFLVLSGLLALSLVEGAMYHPYPIAMAVLAIAWVLAADLKSARPEEEQKTLEGECC